MANEGQSQLANEGQSQLANEGQSRFANEGQSPSLPSSPREAQSSSADQDSITSDKRAVCETLQLSEPNEGEKEQGKETAQAQEAVQHWESLLEDGQHAQVKNKKILRVAARLSIPSNIRQRTRPMQTPTMAGLQHAVDR